jgi:hypothetical protein
MEHHNYHDGAAPSSPCSKSSQTICPGAPEKKKMTKEELNAETSPIFFHRLATMQQQKLGGSKGEDDKWHDTVLKPVRLFGS